MPFAADGGGAAIDSVACRVRLSSSLRRMQGDRSLTNYTWTGPQGTTTSPASGDWQTASNWVVNGTVAGTAPGAGDNVFVQSGAAQVAAHGFTIHVRQSATIGQVTVGNNNDFANIEVDPAATLTVTGTEAGFGTVTVKGSGTPFAFGNGITPPRPQLLLEGPLVNSTRFLFGDDAVVEAAGATSQSGSGASFRAGYDNTLATSADVIELTPSAAANFYPGIETFNQNTQLVLLNTTVSSVSYTTGNDTLRIAATVKGASAKSNIALDLNSYHPTNAFQFANYTDASGNPYAVITERAGVAGGQKLHGSHTQYVLAEGAGGALYLQDKVAGRDGTQTLPGVSQVTFTDGVGLYDPTGTAEAVTRLYQAALHRAPDLGGVTYWTGVVDNSHAALADVAGAFAQAPEFIADYGALDNAGFVQQLYKNVLNRAGDAGGVQYWDNALAAGASRGAVLLSFAQSPEERADTLPIAGDRNDAEAYRLYAAALNRAPDAGGQAYWSQVLSNGASPAAVASGFIGSAEFTQKYGMLDNAGLVTALYKNVLKRAPDAGGQSYWTGQLQAGASRAQVLVGFSDSPENRIATAAATHDAWVYLKA
jgi:Domain of unknown function (DUF4214)